jgi:protein-S-isoprenylcysteine O-methyltransferase Ste14
MTSSEHAKDHPPVLLPPPVLYLSVLALGFGCQWLLPIAMPSGGVVRGLGIALILVGGVLGLWGVAHFWRAGTHVPPHKPTLAIVSGGPFRFSRNPLYIGLNLITAGIALVIANPWILIWMVPAFAVLHRGVVLREEAYLEAKFGAAYTDFKNRTRRWL